MESSMTEAELIYLASKAFDKGWDFETLKYGWIICLTILTL